MSNSQSASTPAEVIFDDQELICGLGLDWTPQKTQDYLAGVPKYYVKRLEGKDIVPAPRIFYAEDEQSRDEWTQKWKDVPLQDARKGKKNMHQPDDLRKIEVIDRSVFKYVVGRGEAALFFDQGTGDLVFARLPRMVQNPDILAAINEMCKKTVRERRCVRRDDPGSLVDAGYTAGSRHNRANTISRSHLRAATNTEIQAARINFEESSMATLVWNIIKRRLPSQIINDFNNVIDANKLPRMNGELEEGLYSVWSVDGKKEYRFAFEEAAPPRAACAMNYARFCHNETGRSAYAVALTTVSTAKPSTGGNFFVAQYGILSLAEVNTVTAWRVHDYHGTSLYHLTPRQNSGVAFFVPTSLIPNVAPEPKFTFEQILNTPRPPLRQRVGPDGNVGHVNRHWLRGDTPEPESDAAEGSRDVQANAASDAIAEDGATAAEVEMLELGGEELGELYEKEHHS